MASNGDDTLPTAPFASEDQEQKKTPAVSFGFTKALSKFKPLAGDIVAKKEDKDFLTGINGNGLQR